VKTAKMAKMASTVAQVAMAKTAKTEHQVFQAPQEPQALQVLQVLQVVAEEDPPLLRIQALDKVYCGWEPAIQTSPHPFVREFLSQAATQCSISEPSTFQELIQPATVRTSTFTFSIPQETH
jgi:hypothetical protein